MKYFLFLTIFFTFSAHARFIQAESRFSSEDSDSLAFIKDQLLHQSFYHAAKKELKNMGLDEKNFVEIYDQEFNDYFSSIQEKIAAKHGFGQADFDQKKQESYRKELRLAKLKARKNFKGIANVIKSYVVKKMSRSPANPNLRFMTIEASINRDELTKLYYSMVSNKQDSGEIEKIYLDINYQLNNASWDDLGVANFAAFHEVLNQNWLKWFIENKPSNVKDIELLNPSKKSLINEWQTNDSGGDLLKNSVVLVLNLKISKLETNEKINEYNFNYQGDVLIKDLSSGKFIFEKEIDQKNKKHFDLKAEDLQNVVANYLYRYPLSEFSLVNKTLLKIQFQNRDMVLEITKFDQVEDLWKFTEALKTSGISLNLQADITDMTQNSARIHIRYSGDQSSFQALLLRLTRSWPDQKLKLQLNGEQDNISIELVRSGQEIPTS